MIDVELSVNFKALPTNYKLVYIIQKSGDKKPKQRQNNVRFTCEIPTSTFSSH